MSTLEERFQCPYCWETISVIIDISVPFQNYIEDCSVCCRPIELTVQVTGETANIVAKRDDE